MTMQELTSRILLNNLIEAINWHKAHCEGNCNVSLTMLIETAKFMLLFVPSEERNGLQNTIYHLNNES